MPTAKKTKSGSWRVQAAKVIDGCLVKKSFTAKDKRTAEKNALDWQTEVTEILNNTDMTLDMACSKYLELKSNRLKAGTKVAYEKYQRNYFKNLMHRRIDKITKSDVDVEINKMLKTLSSKTVRSAAAYFVTVIRYFTKNHIEAEMPKKTKSIHNTPNEKMLCNIINASKGTDIEVPVLLASWLGLRHSEVSGLKWSDVYDDYVIIENAIVVNNGKKDEGDPKTTGTIRKVLLPKYIKDVLDKQPRKTEYVVNMHYATLGKHFSKLLKDNNLPHCRFHDLRHTNASLMLKVMPNKYAMERGGWETEEVLQGIYQQTFSEEHLEYSRKFDDYFAQNVLSTSLSTSLSRKKYRLKRRI
jgi:integrase